MNIFSVPNNKKVVSVISQKFINIVASLALFLSPLTVILVNNPAFAAAPGAIRINEFMPDPSAVTDSNGEWIELRNTTGGDIDLLDWDINDGGTIHTFGSLSVPANGQIVICKNGSSVSNGGVTCNYTWSGMSLNNSGDTITLRDETDTTINSVTYGSGNVSAGHSVNVANNGALSLETVYQYGAGDYGTPFGTTLLDTFDPTLSTPWPFDGVFISETKKTIHITAKDDTLAPSGIDTVTARIWNGTNDSGLINLLVEDPSKPNRYSLGYNNSVLADGVYQIDFEATDNNGNNTALTQNNITVDNTHPTASLDSPIDGDVLSGIVDIYGTGSDANINLYQITISSGGTLVQNIVRSVTSDFTNELLVQLDTFTLPNGSYTIRLHVRDKAGNGAEGNKNGRTAVVTINNSVPIITVDALTTTSVSPELTGTVDDTTASITVNVDGTNYAAVNNGDGTWTLPAGTISPDLSVGVYDVVASATNPQGTGVDATVDELTVEVLPPPGPNPDPDPDPDPIPDDEDDSDNDSGSSTNNDPSVVTTFNNTNTGPGVDIDDEDENNGEEDEQTGEVSSTDSDQTSGEVKADTDIKPNWFMNLLKWLIPLLLLLLFLFLLFKRRKKDEEDN